MTCSRPYCLARSANAEELNGGPLSEMRVVGRPCRAKCCLSLLHDDLVTRFVRQMVDFKETGVVIDSNKIVLLIQFKKVAGDF